MFAGLVALTAAGLGGGSVLFGICGPFTDTAADAFCPSVLEIFTLGITTGTTPTTYAPGDSVTRLQMAAFLSRTVDGLAKRGSPRAVSGQFWTPQNKASLGVTTVGSSPERVACDGEDVWVSNFGGTVSRVRASDGRLLETWTGATFALGVLVAIGGIFVTSNTSRLYRIDPNQPAGVVTTVASNLGGSPNAIAFDGARIWTSNGSNSISIVTPGATIPWSVTTVTTGFAGGPGGILYDGANIWAAISNLDILVKLDLGGAILQTVTLGSKPVYPVYDGTNIWVPDYGSSTVSVVRAATGVVLASLTGNGINAPIGAAFDGERILVTQSMGDNVSLWKAADLTPLGFFSTGTGTIPHGVCSDGLNFWITLANTGQLARF
jgi:hypothetical protein